MSENTPNIGLIKPSPTDFFNVAHMNGNSDKLDINIENYYTKAESELLLSNKVDVGVPTEHDILLPSDFVSDGKCVYSKSENGLVNIMFSAHDPTLTEKIPTQMTLFTLPFGFRPTQMVSFSITAPTGGENRSGACHIHPDGKVVIIVYGLGKANYIFGQGSYYV